MNVRSVTTLLLSLVRCGHLDNEIAIASIITKQSFAFLISNFVIAASSRTHSFLLNTVIMYVRTQIDCD
jgi:hypothetical protein